MSTSDPKDLTLAHPAAFNLRRFSSTAKEKVVQTEKELKGGIVVVVVVKFTTHAATAAVCTYLSLQRAKEL